MIIVETIISVILIALILVQGRGAGLGASFGGSGEFYRSKRGLEGVLFKVTIGFIFLFLVSSLVTLIVY